jgi:hypothetical protein
MWVVMGLAGLLILTAVLYPLKPPQKIRTPIKCEDQPEVEPAPEGNDT